MGKPLSINHNAGVTSEWLRIKSDQNTWGNHMYYLNITSKWFKCNSYHETDSNYMWHLSDLKVPVIMKQMAIVSDMKITSKWLENNSYHDPVAGCQRWH